MKRLKIIGEYLAGFVLIFVLIMVIAGVVVVKFYGDEVQDYTMSLINDNIDTKVSVDEIGISIFRKFPNTSVFFNDVILWSGHDFNRQEFTGISTDTLFTADRIYLEFNLLKMLRKKFSIKSLEARNGKVRVLIDSTGNTNYNIAKKSEDSDASIPLEMKGVIIKGMDLFFINRAKEMNASLLVEEIIVEGNFSSKDYVLKAGGKAFVEAFENHGVSYLANQSIQSDLSLKVEERHFTISRGNLVIDQQEAAIQGEFLSDPAGTDLDIHFTGKRIDLAWISEILASLNSGPKGISGSGIFDLNVDVTGIITSTITPHIDAKFSTNNGSLKIDSLPFRFDKINLDGSYTNGTYNKPWSSSVSLNSFSFRSGNSDLQGSGNISNLVNPAFELNLKGELHASDANKFDADLPILFSSGKLSPDIFVKGSIEKIKNSGTTFNFIPRGTIGISDLGMIFIAPDYAIEKLNGTVTIASNQFKYQLDGNFEDTDFNASLTSSNPLSRKGLSPFIVEGNIEGSEIDVDRFQKTGKKKQSDKPDKKAFNASDAFRLDIDFSFAALKKGHVETRRVNGNILYRYPNFSIDPVYLETMEGAINSSLKITDLDKNNPVLNLNSNFRNVDITSIFYSFNNFGQDFLTQENIGGNISGSSQFVSTLAPGFKMDSRYIVSENSFIIENGELKDFQPMIELSKFLKIDKMDHIKFSTLSNTILIRDNQITIPRMDINSSAINIQASGRHGFDKTYEYHLATKLSEYLFSKAQSSGKGEFEIALDKEDKRTIFLVLRDDGKGVKVDFDEEEARQKIRQDIKDEKGVLKSVLNKEFGMFKRDSSVIKNQEKEKSPEFQFDFSEKEETRDSVKNEDKTKRRWWKKKDEEDKKEEFEYVIEN